MTQSVELVIYDFDGVMTDNRALVLQDGTEGVFVNRSDGLGIGGLKKLGVKQIIVSTETNPVVSARARKLGIEAHQAIEDKSVFVRDYLSRSEIPSEKTMFIGNDVNDLGALAQVGMKACPADAYPEVLNVCEYVFRARGGEGVCRELYGLVRDGSLLSIRRQRS